MKAWLNTSSIFGVLLLGFNPDVAIAQGSPPAKDLVEFSIFKAGIRSTSASQMISTPFSAVKTLPAAEEMRAHLLALYENVDVKHSYALGDRVYDCVPIEQQVSVRQLHLKAIASPPPMATFLDKSANTGVQSKNRVSQRDPTGFDPSGNSQYCENGSIPVARVTLDEMMKFGSLRKFFEKGPDGAGRPSLQNGEPAAINGHSYAYGYAYKNNYGGSSSIALYSPYVNVILKQIFSLSQQWYVGGTGSSLQTVEIGMQNYPSKYGSEASRLFIYWTANNYQSTGCYNLDCAGFVQVNNNWHLGGKFPYYSVSGGTQYDVPLGFYLFQGNWWMAAGADWVGYYPGGIYLGGQLSRYAQQISFGGETFGSTSWPPMGSGTFAAAGWPYAAYQRTITYRDAANNSYNPTLTMLNPSPSCYTASSPAWSTSWKTYFYVGGPGGSGC